MTAPSSRRGMTLTLERLAAGEQPSPTELAALSDLSRDEAAELRASWQLLPLDARGSLLEMLAGLSETNIDLNFDQVGRVGLEDPDPAVRVRAVDSLWESTDRFVGSRLAALVRDDPDEGVRAACAAALGPFVLLHEYEDYPAKEGDDIVDALRAAAMDHEQPVPVRAAALEAVSARGLPWVDELINEAYYADDARLRLAALRAMGNTTSQHWLEYVHEQLQSDDTQFRFEAAQSAGEIASEDSLDELEPLLADDDSDLAVAAIAALGEIGGARAIETLKRYRVGATETLAAAIDVALELASEFGIREIEDDTDDDDEDDGGC